MFPHYFQVVKVVEVEVVETMKAATVESTVMTTMIWILNLHLAVPHLAVLVEIGLFVCLFVLILGSLLSIVGILSKGIIPKITHLS